MCTVSVPILVAFLCLGGTRPHMDGLQGPLWVWALAPQAPIRPLQGGLPRRSGSWPELPLPHAIPWASSASFTLRSFSSAGVWVQSLHGHLPSTLCLVSHQRLHFPGGQTGHVLNSQLLLSRDTNNPLLFPNPVGNSPSLIIDSLGPLPLIKLYSPDL